jgi:hypothetical protein
MELATISKDQVRVYRAPDWSNPLVTQESSAINGEGLVWSSDGSLLASLNSQGGVSVYDANDDYKKIGWVSGIFKSFNDAPGGFSEELREITYSAAAEYLYQDSFAMRMGYFHESPLKGARQYFTFGAGFKYNVVKIDVSYLMSTSKVQNPLENTLRFSLTFNFGDKYEEY